MGPITFKPYEFNVSRPGMVTDVVIPETLYRLLPVVVVACVRLTPNLRSLNVLDEKICTNCSDPFIGLAFTLVVSSKLTFGTLDNPWSMEALNKLGYDEVVS